MQILGNIVHKLDAITKWSGSILAMLVYVMAAIMLFEVLSRYVWQRPTIWCLDTTTMVFGVYVVGIGAYAILHRAHIRIDVFYTRWSKRTQAVVDACTFVLFLSISVTLLWKSAIYGWASVIAREHAMTVWGPPLYHWKMAVAVLALLFLLQGISNFIRDLTFIISRHEIQ